MIYKDNQTGKLYIHRADGFYGKDEEPVVILEEQATGKVIVLKEFDLEDTYLNTISGFPQPCYTMIDGRKEPSDVLMKVAKNMGIHIDRVDMRTGKRDDNEVEDEKRQSKE